TDVIIPYISGLKEVSCKDEQGQEDYTNAYNVPLTFDRRYVSKIVTRLSCYHFSKLKKFIPLLTSREEFLGEKSLNIYNRTIYVTIPRTMDSSVLTPTERLNILERYFSDVAKQIKAGYSKHRGTGKFIGYPIKEYIANYRKRVPNYDTGIIG